MKVNRPRSTYGRNASCCALLKRCTSSTKRMVCRPDCCERQLGPLHRLADVLDAGEHRGERDELGVERLAPSGARAWSCPTPGGPHRIIECGLPDSNASRSGLPGPSRCVWPTTSSSVRGRSARRAVRAAARCGSASCRRDRPSRTSAAAHWSLVPMTSAPLGGVKRNVRRRASRCARWRRSAAPWSGRTGRAAPSPPARRPEAQAHALEADSCVARHRLEPVEAVLGCRRP